MPGDSSFDGHHRRYEEWYVTHGAAYCSELLAVRALLPRQGYGLEIGVGTGRFAAPLGVTVGIEPSPAMLEYARERGIHAVQGVAEQLPFADESFDYALSVTTICFVNDIRTMLREARRVIRPDGCLILGFVDRGSELGRRYLDTQRESVFYRNATFHSAEEIEQLLRETGFPCQEWVQTLSAPLPDIVEIEPFRGGHGDNAFVVVKAMGAQPSPVETIAEGNCMFHRLTDFSADWTYWRTPTGEMRYISPAGNEITGYSVEELSTFPETCIKIIHPDDRELWRNHVHEADRQGKPKPIEFRIVTRDGGIRWISHLCRPVYDDNGVFLGISGSNRDITERKQAEEKLLFLSTHDELTGLFNRAYFEAEIERLAGGRQFPVSVVMADVDGLKAVNDNYGHGEGDRLLQEAAKVLLEAFRAEDVVARIGGDEFVVLLPGADSAIVAGLLERITASQEAVNCSGVDCPVRLSIGAATVLSGTGLRKALKLADKKMYENKLSKKHR